MESSEEKYIERIKEIEIKLNEPKMKSKVDKILKELSTELDCVVKFNFNVHPEIEEYEEHVNGEAFIIPRNVTPMRLGDFIDHLAQEDRDFKMYIDPLYMKEGVNEINDVLTTTVNDAIIVVPITTKKQV